MRSGYNPNLNNPAPYPPTVSLCVVTHCGDGAYFRDKMRVTALCIDSMLAGAHTESTELIIWDNGSTRVYRDFLRREFSPTILIESINVGQINARRALANIARGGFVNFTDDDILYHPRWLAKQLEVMRTYPDVGCVSGSPINFEFSRPNKPVTDFIYSHDVMVTVAPNLIPAEWRADFMVSVGKNPSRRGSNNLECLLEYRGVKAWSHGHHMQMLTLRSLAAMVYQPANGLLEADNSAEYFSTAGYLQLTTHDRTAVHIGNVIDPTIERIEAEWQPNRKPTPM